MTEKSTGISPPSHETSTVDRSADRNGDGTSTMSMGYSSASCRAEGRDTSSLNSMSSPTETSARSTQPPSASRTSFSMTGSSGFSSASAGVPTNDAIASAATNSRLNTEFMS